MVPPVIKPDAGNRLSETECRAALQRAFGWRLGAITHIGERHTYPLRLVTAARHIAHRVALVGNAAQTLHPIAGQGFNLGLRDVISLAETPTQAATSQEDTGSYRVLSRYAQRRESDQQATIALTDGLVRLFANSVTSLEMGRNLGLMTMNTVAPVRDTLRAARWVGSIVNASNRKQGLCNHLMWLSRAVAWSVWH